MLSVTKHKKDVEFQLDSIESALEEIKKGGIIIVVDDESRENEGDFVCAAECVTPEIVNFMARYGRGLICTPVTEELAKKLDLSRMVSSNTDKYRTAFTVSIDYTKKGCTTGISAYDRATGIQAMVNQETMASDFARPGHIFPLIAKEGGVLKRCGHTEAAIDLSHLAGFKSAGVLVEIMNEDGTMARLPELIEIAKEHALKIISIDDLIKYRLERESLVKAGQSLDVETQYGTFQMIHYKEMSSHMSHIILKYGEWTSADTVLTRVHAGTNTSELFTSLLYGSENQIQLSLKKIAENGSGVLVLIRYDEIENSIDKTMDELIANKQQNKRLNPYIERKQKPGNRDIGIGAQILHDLGIRKINLLTNSDFKSTNLHGFDMEIVSHTPLY